MRVSLPAAAGLLIAGVFVVRAVVGVPAAWAYHAGRALREAGEYEAAGSLLDRGIEGGDRTEVLWRAGRARLSLWESVTPAQRRGQEGERVLRIAAARFLDGRRASPAAAWFMGALAAVYADREKVAQSGRLTDLASLARGPWALLGDDGRIAIGLTRAAIARWPGSFELRDQLVIFLEAFGLHDDALRAVEDAARVLPDFGAHPEFAVEDLPRDIVERFWSTARSLGPGDAPLLPRERLLLSVGQLGRRLGHLEEAERDMRAAMTAPATRVGRAEEAFHLGQVLIDGARFDEAEAMLALAVREPVFGPGVAEARARIAEKQGRWEDALEQVREMRRLQPKDVGVLLRFASVARRAGGWDQAEESLRWAILVDPSAEEPRAALIELLAAKDGKPAAARALEDYIRALGRTPYAVRMEQTLAVPLDPTVR